MIRLKIAKYYLSYKTRRTIIIYRLIVFHMTYQFRTHTGSFLIKSMINNLRTSLKIERDEFVCCFTIIIRLLRLDENNS